MNNLIKNIQSDIASITCNCNKRVFNNTDDLLVRLNDLTMENFDEKIPYLCNIYCYLLDMWSDCNGRNFSEYDYKTIPMLVHGNSLSRLFYQAHKYGKVYTLKHSVSFLEDLYDILTKNIELMWEKLPDTIDGVPVTKFPDYYDWRKYKHPYISWKNTLETLSCHSGAEDVIALKSFGPISYVLQPDYEFQIISSKIPKLELIHMLAILARNITPLLK